MNESVYSPRQMHIFINENKKKKKDETEHDQTARYINRTESNGLVNKLRLYILLQGFRITCNNSVSND